MIKFRPLRPAAVACALALLATGCGGDDDESATGSSTTTAADSPARGGTAGLETNTPVVKLLDAGADPQKKLRLALVKGATLRASLILKFGFELEAQGKPLPSNAIPPIRVDLGATVNDIEENGDAEVGFSYERIDVVDDGTVDKAVIEQVRNSGLDKLANVTGTTTISPRGVAVDSELDVPEDLPPALKQVVDQLSQQTGSLTVPFPEEAVGNGAKWQATTNVDVGGIDAKLVLTYGLRQLQGDQYTLDVSYEQTADRQKTDFPGVPEGTEVELQDLLVKGTGEISGNVAAVFPTRSNLSAAGTVNMEVTSEQEKGKLLQRLTLDVKFETLPSAP